MASLDKGKKSGLGRGLGSLLGGDLDDIKIEPSLKNNSLEEPELKVKPVMGTPNVKTEPAIPKEARIWKIAIEKITPNEVQPRKEFDKEKIKELSESIKTHGLIQPITVRQSGPEAYELIAGERRWRASQLAGLGEIPAIIKEVDNRQSLEWALIENIQRADLNPIEEGEAYQKLVEDYGLTQQEISERVGKERTTVANFIRLLALDPEVRKLVASEEITMGHAKVLLSVEDPKKQRKLAFKVKKAKLSVRNLEKVIKKDQEPKSAADLDVDVSQKLVKQISEDLQKRLGTKVTIDYNNKKGKVSIHFYSDDELSEITERLKNSWT